MGMSYKAALMGEGVTLLHGMFLRVMEELSIHLNPCMPETLKFQLCGLSLKV